MPQKPQNIKKSQKVDTPFSTKLIMALVAVIILVVLYYFFGNSRFPMGISFDDLR